MKIDILTLFPEMFAGPFDESMIKRARKQGFVEINIHNLRDWATDKHKTVDERPYGGGKGMVIRVDVMDRAIKQIKSASKKAKVILLTPQGKVFTQAKARELAKKKHLIFIAGHYEGFDERIREHLVDEEISIGDYVLTGGELPAMVVVDSIVRLIPGVLDTEATEHESFSVVGADSGQRHQQLDFPQYTRPEEYKSWKVPQVLMNGNHKEIETWRKEESFKKTKEKRPDLL